MGSKSESKMPSSKPEKPRSGGEGAVFSNSEEQKKKKILSLSYVGKILQIYPNRALVSPLNFSETLSRGWSR